MISPVAEDALNSAQDVVWLTLNLDRLPENETLELLIKKPLFAASVVLGFVKNVDEGHLTVRAEIKAKIPLIGNKQIEVTSKTNFLSETCGFSLYEERQFGQAARSWSFHEENLEWKKEDEEVPRQSVALDPHSIPASHLLNSLLVLTALTSSAPVGEKVYASQLVVAGKLMALKFSRAAGSTVLNILAKEVSHALTSEEWSLVDWSGAHQVEGVWDVEEEVVTALKIRVPVLGLVELPLTRTTNPNYKSQV